MIKDLSDFDLFAIGEFLLEDGTFDVDYLMYYAFVVDVAPYYALEKYCRLSGRCSRKKVLKDLEMFWWQIKFLQRFVDEVFGAVEFP